MTQQLHSRKCVQTIIKWTKVVKFVVHSNEKKKKNIKHVIINFDTKWLRIYLKFDLIL